MFKRTAGTRFCLRAHVIIMSIMDNVICYDEEEDCVTRMIIIMMMSRIIVIIQIIMMIILSFDYMLCAL